jgi:hypothetical protein
VSEQVLSEEQIEKAVNWWADQIQNPRYQTLSSEERKDPATLPAAGAEALMTKAAANMPKLGPEQIDTFKKALASILRRENPRYIRVDYDPDIYLAGAADEASISHLLFSWKTSMLFENGGVRAGVGYGTLLETI